MERLEKRDAPSLGDQPADSPGKPVVAVNRVVERGLEPGLFRFVRFESNQRVEEFADVLVELFFGDRPVGSRDQVDDADTRVDLTDELPFARPTREDVDRDAHLCEATGDRPHVDVHPTGVADARLVERTRVNGEKCHARHRRRDLEVGQAGRFKTFLHAVLSQAAVVERRQASKPSRCHARPTFICINGTSTAPNRYL